MSAGSALATSGLDPRGRIHIPIGIANTVDSLKTFVEAEGVFSPGCGSFGVYVWVFDEEARRLHAPTMDGVAVERGLTGEGYLIPWSSWRAGEVAVRTTVCHVRREGPAGKLHLVGAEVRLTNEADAERRLRLYVGLRPLGPAGFDIKKMSVGTGGALLVEGHPALVCGRRPSAAGVLPTDTVGLFAAEGGMPAASAAGLAALPSGARSPGKNGVRNRLPGRPEGCCAQTVPDTVFPAGGDCSGAVRFDLAIGPGRSETVGFVCPVLPGRRAAGHRWDGESRWAQLDLMKPDPGLGRLRHAELAGRAGSPGGGSLQPDPGLEYYRGVSVGDLFAEARAYWEDLAGRVKIDVPDARWSRAWAAIVGHAALAMNEGAPDVAVVNYNVFNRDGVYVANILQKSGRADLAQKAVDYFLAHPFNGRVRVEADNPGQVLWIMGQHWLFTRDRVWLERVYPSAAKIAAMIRYYRTRPGPHYVKATSLEFGDALPPDGPGETSAERRQILEPGSCDGRHPEYTEAFDIAGLRAAGVLARAAGRPEHASAWEALAGTLSDAYHKRFGSALAKGYGSYSVLWPCGLYGYDEGPAHDVFRKVGARGPKGWRYFPLATAHQGLLAGNRDAGHGTVARHLAHEQMRGWYAFDEGGKSGAGGWRHYRTTWNPAVAMPHGWAVAEMWLLIRDCIAFEDRDRIVLLAGVPEAWFAGEMSVEGMPTHFGTLSFAYASQAGGAPAPRSAEAHEGATLSLGGDASPPGGFVVRTPRALSASATADGRPLVRLENGDVLVPRGTGAVALEFRGRTR